MTDHPAVLWTLGHSNRDLSAFIRLLEEAKISVAADIRSFPGSKRHPWFNREVLSSALAEHRIEYIWLKELGGRRKAAPGPSPHTALQGSGFKNYVDWMESEPFQERVERLIQKASKNRCAIFCAEKDPKKCHRQFLSDLLTIRGICLVHIIDSDRYIDHVLHPDLVIHRGKGIYKGRQGTLFEENSPLNP